MQKLGNDIVPATTPRLSATSLLLKIAKHKVDLEQYKVLIVGIRGYYKNTMGEVGANDRGIYDDAIFVYSPDGMIAYNANTDPSKVRKGRGKGKAKGMASLKQGVYYAHRLGLHKSKYEALIQTAGEVTVLRDSLEGEPYEDTGFFGINIHAGLANSTGSEGCQTIPPLQYKGFICNVKDFLRRYYPQKWQTQVVPYILINN
jgi:lysozyme